MNINIEFDDELKKCIESINNGKGKPVITNTDEIYTIEFKATDIGTANAFIYELMKSNNTLSKTLGISVEKLYRGSALNNLNIMMEGINESRI